ncbi:MAG: hypothetical protein IJ532_06750 [Alphaproteobacteria bacterium]|nr:hypothetical protein [Alphaproteobacteria bacterium]
MPNLEERLQAVVSQSETDSSKWHTIVHGDDTTTVPTENGNVPSVAKQLKDVRAEIINGLEDYVGDCRQAKADTLQIKSETQIIKNETNTLKGQTKTLRDEAETFKDLSQTTYNSIASATAASISQVQSEGAVQVALATAQAERALAYAQNAAPTPLGTKLTVPASSKVPDGYEPVWYKNTITRARYPDFFTQLVDTNSLVLVDEETYDSQVATYGMCASYVKVDNNTLILPLLVNFARGGTLNQLGNVELDQFQGHYHIAQIRQDVWGSGDGATIGTTNGTDEGLRQDGPDLFILNPKTGQNGTARFGDETRPKAYYELTYIKCADVTRTLTVEETSELRNLVILLQQKLEEAENRIVCSKTPTTWVEKDTKTGLIKQGGKVTIATSGTVTFPEPFPNTAISVIVTPSEVPTNSTSDNNYVACAVSVTKSTFIIKYYDSDNTSGRTGVISWSAVGY